MRFVQGAGACEEHVVDPRGGLRAVEGHDVVEGGAVVLERTESGWRVFDLR